jgi:2-polyprenyl-3-methyl-5-hydroxy-6-metoxy-1,4-benzoquinol methylase
MSENYLEVNKKFWNKQVDIHVNSEFYAMDTFKTGRSSLNKIELDLIEDIYGKSLLHIQCHFGQDTLSFARMGAKVTGVDFSSQGIERARQLAEELQTKADFICCNILEMDKYVSKKFDIVFASYGVIGWHPSLEDFMEQISLRLRKGGNFYLVEFHPVLWIFDENFKKIKYSYFNKGPIIEEFYGSYAEKNSKVLNKSYGWNHSFAELFDSLSKNRLKIKHFCEYDYSPYDIFNKSIKTESGYQIKGIEEKLPYIFSLVSEKI